jgi:peptidyl-prolyl cis-trans isomerase D
MIQQMRNNAATIMWVVIIAFVATIVFAWGMDITVSPQQKNLVGKIQGKEIPIHQFERMVEQERQRQQERMGGMDLPSQQSRMIPRQVWETEVNRILLKEVFTKMQLGASSEQLYEYIKRNPPQEVYHIPQFQTDSMFDTSKYIQFLNDPRAYENEGMRMLEQHTRDMAIPMQTLQALFSAQGEPSKTEIADEYRSTTEKTSFEYAKLSIAGLPVDSTDVTEQKISNYYGAHADSFESDEQADLYFVKFPKIATEKDVATVRNDLTELKNKIGNSDSLFQEEAKVESDDDATAKNGGDLGWISKGMMVPAFDSLAFSMPVGVVSDPVRTQFGYHLVFVEKREMKDKAMQAKVRHLLRKIAPSGETLDRLNSQADSLQKLISADGIAAVMGKKQPGFIFDSTGLFKRGDMIPKIGFLSGAASFAFTHENDEVSDIIENEDGYFVLQVKSRLKKGLQPLSAVREKIVQVLSDSSRALKARKRFEEDLRKMTDKADVIGLMKLDPLIVAGKTDTVTRARYVPQVGANNEAVAAAFALKPGAVSGIINTKDALFVVKPLWQAKIDANAIPWNGVEMAELKKKLESDAVQKAYYDWYLDYRSRAKIMDNLSHFYMD